MKRTKILRRLRRGLGLMLMACALLWTTGCPSNSQRRRTRNGTTRRTAAAPVASGTNAGTSRTTRSGARSKTRAGAYPADDCLWVDEDGIEHDDCDGVSFDPITGDEVDQCELYPELCDETTGETYDLYDTRDTYDTRGTVESYGSCEYDPDLCDTSTVLGSPDGYTYGREGVPLRDPPVDESVVPAVIRDSTDRTQENQTLSI